MRFKQYLTEDKTQNVLNWGKEMLFHWKNMWIVDTIHGEERLKQRNKLSDKQLKKLFRETIEAAIERGMRYGDKALFVSRKLKQELVGAIDRAGNLVLVTFLPHNVKSITYAHPEEDVILIEGETLPIVEV